MAFFGPQDLESYLNESIISPYDSTRIKQAAYELSLGDEVYRTDNKEGKSEKLDSRNKTVQINPGQFTLLLTKEVVNIPPDKLAFISIKAKQKLKGLVNVSGFHVDPGFNGNLLFSVYNAGPSAITLETGKPYFLIWFSDLKSPASGSGIYNSTANEHQNQDGISVDYIDPLKRGELASPHVLLEKIKDLEHTINKYSWAIGVTITLAGGLLIRMLAENNSYKEGVEYGKKVSEFSAEIRKESNKFLTDSLSLYRIDSLINEKLKVKDDRSK